MRYRLNLRCYLTHLVSYHKVKCDLGFRTSGGDLDLAKGNHMNYLNFKVLQGGAYHHVTLSQAKAWWALACR